MRSKILSVLGLIALLSSSPFQVTGRIADNNSRYPHKPARTSKLTTKSQQRSTRPSAEIPFELSGHLIFLKGRVNGSTQSLWFLLDSGVSRSMLDVKMAQALGLKLEGVDSGNTPVGPVSFSYVENVSFNLNGLVLPKQEIVAAPLGSFASILGRRVDGILGYEFFQHHVIELNYQKRLITIHDPKDFTYPVPASSVNAVFVNNIPFVKAGVKQTGSQFREGYFEIDTGAADLTLYQLFVDGQKLLETSQPRLLVPLAGINGSDSVRTGIVTRLGGLQLGSSIVESPLTVILERSPPEDVKFEVGGIIGGEILWRFTVIFDYPSERITFIPNSDFNDPFLHDRSGMSLIAEGNNFTVTRIFRISPNSPAAEAGLRVGDLILAIDGRSTAHLPLAEERKLFTQEVKGYNLTVRRNGKTLRVRLNLRKLI